MHNEYSGFEPECSTTMRREGTGGSVVSGPHVGRGDGSFFEQWRGGSRWSTFVTCPRTRESCGFLRCGGSTLLAFPHAATRLFFRPLDYMPTLHSGIFSCSVWQHGCPFLLEFCGGDTVSTGGFSVYTSRGVTSCLKYFALGML